MLRGAEYVTVGRPSVSVLSIYSSNGGRVCCGFVLSNQSILHELILVTSSRGMEIIAVGR